MSDIAIHTDGGDSDNGASSEVEAAVAANEAEHHSEDAAEAASEAESHSVSADIAADSASSSAASSDSAATVALIAADSAGESASHVEAIRAELPGLIAEAVAQALAPAPGEATVIQQTEDGESQVDITSQDKEPKAQHWLEKPIFGKGKRS